MTLNLRHAIEQATGHELVVVVKYDTKEKQVEEVVSVYARHSKTGVCVALDADQFDKQIDGVNWAEVAYEQLNKHI